MPLLTVTPFDIRGALLLRDEIALLDVRHEAMFATGHPLFAANMAVDRIVLEAETRTGEIKIHTHPGDFEGMRRAGRIAAECLDMLVPHVVPGVSTEHLDKLAREFILDHGALETLG